MSIIFLSPKNTEQNKSYECHPNLIYTNMNDESETPQ